MNRSGTRRRGLQALATVTAGAAVAASVLAGASASAAPRAGVVDAKPKVVAAMVADMGLSNAATCFQAQRARSDRRWAAFGLASPLGAGCDAYDGYTVIRKVQRTWEAIPVGGSSVDCSDLRAGLDEYGAPRSVYRDFKRAGYCNRGQ